MQTTYNKSQAIEELTGQLMVAAMSMGEAQSKGDLVMADDWRQHVAKARADILRYALADGEPSTR